MRYIFSLLTLSLALVTGLHAQDNPFESAAQQNYGGRFRGPDVELRLKPDGAKYSGSLLFKGNNYTVEAEVKGSGLEGKFANSEQAWPFSGVVEGDQFTFNAGTFTTALARQKLPKFSGVWGSSKVEIEFESTGEKFTGKIRFNGKEFPFAAEEKSGDLEGVLKNGEKSIPFTVANEPRGLIFQSGAFAERIQRTLKAQVNSLGMKFVPVPGTEVLFCIWDVRVQDFDAFVKASGYDATGEMYSLRNGKWDKHGDTWQSPGFSQGATHPVVGVSWNDAKAFCVWLTKQERSVGKISENQSYRLPTDAEWSVAVGLAGESGSTPKEKYCKIKDVYPWGTSWPPPSGAGNYAGSEVRDGDWPSDWKTIEGYRDDYPHTSPVGSFTANQYGLYDMGGNVWQWCEDWYDGDQKYRVLRGASWDNVVSGDLLSSYRINRTPDYRNLNYGFRCVLVVAGASAAR